MRGRRCSSGCFHVLRAGASLSRAVAARLAGGGLVAAHVLVARSQAALPRVAQPRGGRRGGAGVAHGEARVLVAIPKVGLRWEARSCGKCGRRARRVEPRCEKSQGGSSAPQANLVKRGRGRRRGGGVPGPRAEGEGGKVPGGAARVERPDGGGDRCGEELGGGAARRRQLDRGGRLALQLRRRPASGTRYARAMQRRDAAWVRVAWCARRRRRLRGCQADAGTP